MKQGYEVIKTDESIDTSSQDDVISISAIDDLDDLKDPIVDSEEERCNSDMKSQSLEHEEKTVAVTCHMYEPSGRTNNGLNVTATRDDEKPASKENDENIGRDVEKKIEDVKDDSNKLSIIDGSFIKVLSKDEITELEWPVEMIQHTIVEPKVSYSCNPLYFDFTQLSKKEKPVVTETMMTKDSVIFDGDNDGDGLYPGELSPSKNASIAFVPRQLATKQKKEDETQSKDEEEADDEKEMEEVDDGKYRHMKKKKKRKHKHKSKDASTVVEEETCEKSISKKKHKHRKKRKKSKRAEENKSTVHVNEEACHNKKDNKMEKGEEMKEEEVAVSEIEKKKKHKHKKKNKKKEKKKELVNVLLEDEAMVPPVSNKQTTVETMMVNAPSGTDSEEKHKHKHRHKKRKKHKKEKQENEPEKKLEFKQDGIMISGEGKVSGKRKHEEKSGSLKGGHKRIKIEDGQRNKQGCESENTTAEKPTKINEKKMVTTKVNQKLGIKDTAVSKWDTSDSEVEIPTLLKDEPDSNKENKYNHKPRDSSSDEDSDDYESRHRRRSRCNSYSSESDHGGRRKHASKRRSYSSDSDDYKSLSRSYTRSRSSSRSRSRSYHRRHRSYSSYTESDDYDHRRRSGSSRRHRRRSSSCSRSYSSDYRRNRSYSRSRSRYSSYSRSRSRSRSYSRSYSRSRSRSRNNRRRYEMKNSPAKEFSSVLPKKEPKPHREQKNVEAKTFEPKELVMPLNINKDEVNERAQELLKKIKEKKQSLKDADHDPNDSVPVGLKSAGLIPKNCISGLLGPSPAMLEKVPVLPVIGKLPNSKKRKNSDDDEKDGNDKSLVATCSPNPGNIPLPNNNDSVDLSDIQMPKSKPPQKKAKNSVKSEFENKVPLCRGPRSEMDSIPLPPASQMKPDTDQRVVHPVTAIHPLPPRNVGPNLMRGPGPAPGPMRGPPPGLMRHPCPRGLLGPGMMRPGMPPRGPPGPRGLPPHMGSRVPINRVPGLRGPPPPSLGANNSPSSGSASPQPQQGNNAQEQQPPHIPQPHPNAPLQMNNRPSPHHPPRVISASGPRTTYIGPQVPPGMAQSLGLDISQKFKKPNNLNSTDMTHSEPPLPLKESDKEPPLPPSSPPKPKEPEITPMEPPVLSAEQQERYKELAQQAQQHAALQQQREAGVTPTSESENEAPGSSTTPVAVIASPSLSLPQPVVMSPPVTLQHMQQIQHIQQIQHMQQMHQMQQMQQMAAAGMIPQQIPAGMIPQPGLPVSMMLAAAANQHHPQVALSQGIPIQAGSPLIAATNPLGVAVSAASGGVPLPIPIPAGALHHPSFGHLPTPIQIPAGMTGLPGAVHGGFHHMHPPGLFSLQAAQAAAAAQHAAASSGTLPHGVIPHPLLATAGHQTGGPMILGSPMLLARIPRPQL
ncbi:uncharacterized protein LOC141906667 isoform X2 [Tubulanus polymorphus]